MFLHYVMMWLFLCVPMLSSAAEIDAKRVIQNVQDLMRSNSSTARYTMHIQTADWQRSISFQSWDDRMGNRFFIRVVSPRKEKGTAWLKSGKNLWMYLPKLERDIRIPASMMLSSWMGSDFSNDDLVKMDSVVADYNHRILSQDGTSITIQSTAKPDAPVVWGKIIHVVGRDGIPLRDDYYDEHGVHIRHLDFREVQTIGGRRIPTLWVMIPLSDIGKKTLLKLENATFDKTIPEHVFTRSNLRIGSSR